MSINCNHRECRAYHECQLNDEEYRAYRRKAELDWAGYGEMPSFSFLLDLWLYCRKRKEDFGGRTKKNGMWTLEREEKPF